MVVKGNNDEYTSHMVREKRFSEKWSPGKTVLWKKNPQIWKIPGKTVLEKMVPGKKNPGKKVPGKISSDSSEKLAFIFKEKVQNG